MWTSTERSAIAFESDQCVCRMFAMRGHHRNESELGRRPELGGSAQLSTALRSVGNSDRGRAGGGQAVCLCIASARQECAHLPRGVPSISDLLGEVSCPRVAFRLPPIAGLTALPGR
jgi:hypothetical protein